MLVAFESTDLSKQLKILHFRAFCWGGSMYCVREVSHLVV